MALKLAFDNDILRYSTYLMTCYFYYDCNYYNYTYYCIIIIIIFINITIIFYYITKWPKEWNMIEQMNKWMNISLINWMNKWTNNS